MRKLFFISALSVISILSAIAGAEYPARYVRKQLKPTFFVPDKDLNRSEKLPEFNYYPNKPKAKKVQPTELSTDETQEIQVLEVIDEVDMSDRKPQAELPLPAENVVATKATEVDPRYIDYSTEELAQIPEYKQKYDDYIADLKIIAKTGNVPENPRVSQDLAKMISNDRITIDENFGISPKPVSPAAQTTTDVPTTAEAVSEEVVY